MFLSEVSIKRPVFTAMVIIALMSVGMMSYNRIGVDLFPDISFPIIVTTTVYPGASPEEIEREVTKPIEEKLSSINGITRVRSYSRDSVSVVLTEFTLETDITSAGTDVRERMAALRGELPDDIDDPIIQRFDPASMPIMTFVLSSPAHPAEIRRLAEDDLKPMLEAISGVASVTVVGGLEREVKVLVKRDRMDALGITLAQLAQQLGMETFDLPAGRVESATTEISVKTHGRFRSVEELRNLVVASMYDGAQVRLSDVADVVDGYADVRKKTLLNGKDSVSLEIQKQSGTNTVAVADGVNKVISKIEASLPQGYSLIRAVDTSVDVRRNIAHVEQEIIIGGIMAVFVVFLFMLDWRSTVITSLSLPTSVITTFLVMWLMGFTFNMMSLLGLSLSIGLLIDDAVVVRENIFRHMEMGKDRVSASRDGTNEIGLAVLATTLTIVAVFVPVGFMGGMVGKMFKEFGLTVAAAVLVSLFISFTLDPMMSANVMKPIEPGHHEKLKKHRIFGPIVRFYDGMDAFYKNVLRWALGNPKKVVAGAIAMLVGSLYLTQFMGTEFVPTDDRGEFTVKIETSAESSFAWTEKTVHEVEAAIRRVSPEIRQLYTTIGPDNAANKATIRVYASKALERPGITQWDIQAAIRTELSKMPNLIFAVADKGIIEGGEEPPFTLAVRGDDYDALAAYAQKLLDVVRSTPGVGDADMGYRAGKPETAVRIDRQRAADLGVSTGHVAQSLRLAVEGSIIGKLRDTKEDIDIRLQLAPEDRSSAEELAELSVPSSLRRVGSVPGANPLDALMNQGKRVRIGDVADLVNDTGPAAIEREARRRQIVVSANLAGRPLGDVVGDINAYLKANPPPAGITLSYGGMAERMTETFDNMGMALGIAILFIFFVLASQFESIIHPFTIMISLPLAVVGALLTLFLTGSPIGMASLIGIIMLMGLVTKNGILLVDYTNECRSRGMSVVDALLEAGPTRLRPILMTSAAMALGMLPSAISTAEGSAMRAPMAMSIIGGVVASTFLTLLVVPVVYVWMDRFTLKGREEARKAKNASQTDPVAGELNVAGEDA